MTTPRSRREFLRLAGAGALAAVAAGSGCDSGSGEPKRAAPRPASDSGKVRSGFYNTPSFPKAAPDLDALVAADPAQPAGKYTVISGAAPWSTNIGHPGNSNAAVDEVFQQFLVPKMFAAAARGELSAEDAVARAEAEITAVFAKWREQGKI